MQVDERQFATGQDYPRTETASGLRQQFAVGQEHPVVQRLRDLRQQRGPWPVAVWFVDRGAACRQFNAMLPDFDLPIFVGESGALPEGCPVRGGAGVWVVMSDGGIERLGIGD